MLIPNPPCIGAPSENAAYVCVHVCAWVRLPHPRSSTPRQCLSPCVYLAGELEAEVAETEPGVEVRDGGEVPEETVDEGEAVRVDAAPVLYATHIH